MDDEALQLARRWSDGDDDLPAHDVSRALVAIKHMGEALLSLDAPLAHAVMEFYSDHATEASDPSPLKVLTGHANSFVRLYAIKRLVLSFLDASAANPLVEMIRERKQDEDIAALGFILRCVLKSELGLELSRKLSRYIVNHPLPPEVVEEISDAIRADGLDPSRIFQ